MNTFERTLILIKPDGVRRALSGKIIARLERAGLKLIALKMLQADRTTAEKHYTYEDISVRHGDHIRQILLNYITEGPIIAAVFEGVSAVEVVRKIAGSTEPLKSAPGTIRGDYCHHSYKHCESKKTTIKNVIHASASPNEAVMEVAVWFDEKELNSYRRSDECEHF